MMSSAARKGAPRRAAAVVLAILVASLGSTPSPAKTSCVPDTAAGGEWRLMGGDLANTRTQHLEATLSRSVVPRLAPAWTFDANAASGETLNEITGYPIVADGCVFVGSSRGFGRPGWIFAIDAGDGVNGGGGGLVWKYRVSHGVYSTLAVANGVVYAFVSRIGSPYVLALRESDGTKLWETTVDTQAGSDAVSSPIVYDGMVWVGVSGTAAEGDEEDRFSFRGASVLLDAATGALLHKTYSIPDEEFDPNNDGDPTDGAAGGAIWSTMAVDEGAKTGYVGAGNPFNYAQESIYTNAVFRIDLDRSSPTFGEIIGVYKGEVEEYANLVAESSECDRVTGLFLAGFECAHLDLDFGATPNIYSDRNGRKVAGIGQKSGVYHAIDRTGSCPATLTRNGHSVCVMPRAWRQIMGVPSLVGGIVGSAAYDGTALYVPHTIGGYLAKLDPATGTPGWVAPVADAVHWGPPVTAANGVLYTPDLKGFLDAYDAATGAMLLHRPMGVGANTGQDPTFSWGGVTVARNTVYASIGVGITSAGDMFPSMPNGFVVAFRPAKVGL